MKHSLFLFVCTLCFLFSSLSVMVHEVYAAGIEIVPYNLEDLETEDSEMIDDILYPSGLSLPTKYMDFLDFTPYDGNIIEDDTAEYLLDLYVDANGRFTYAEYKAAERYITFEKILDEDTQPAIAETLVNILGDKTENLSGFDARVNDTTHFKNAMIIYREFYRQVAQGIDPTDCAQWDALTSKMMDSYYLTAGKLGSTDELLVDDDYLSYLSTLPDYWDYFSIEFSKTATPAIPDIDNQVEDDEIIVPTPGLSESTPVEDTIEKQPEKVYIYSDASVSPMFDAHRDADTNALIVDGEEVVVSSYSGELKDFRANEVMNSISPDAYLIAGVTSDTKFGFRDLLTKLALIAVIVSIIAGWIIHTLRTIKDPLYKWKK